MDVLTFSRGRLSKRDLALGIVGSLLVHLSLLGLISSLSKIQPSPVSDLPFYTVSLVTSQEIQFGSPASQKDTASKENISEPSLPAAEAASPVAPVKRLELDNPPDPGLEKLSPAEAPKIPAFSSGSIEKSLENLISKPKKSAEAVALSKGDQKEQETTPSPNQSPTAAQTETGTKGGQSASAQSGGELNLLRRLYYGEVWNAIRSQWILPKTLMNARDMEATLILLIRRDGKILNHRFERRSGNGLFDESVIRAVLKADPLPPFPQAYSPSQEEIGVRFRPEDLN